MDLIRMAGEPERMPRQSNSEYITEENNSYGMDGLRFILFFFFFNGSEMLPNYKTSHVKTWTIFKATTLQVIINTFISVPTA